MHNGVFLSSVHIVFIFRDTNFNMFCVQPCLGLKLTFTSILSWARWSWIRFMRPRLLLHLILYCTRVHKKKPLRAVSGTDDEACPHTTCLCHPCPDPGPGSLSVKTPLNNDCGSKKNKFARSVNVKACLKCIHSSLKRKGARGSMRWCNQLSSIC